MGTAAPVPRPIDPPEAYKDGGGDALALADETEEDVLGADVLVAHL